MRVSRKVMAAASLLLGFGMVGVALPAAGDTPEVFFAEASATGVLFSIDRSNQLPFTPTLDQALSSTRARITSSREELATAGFYDPGEIIRTGPRLVPLVCETLKLPVLPLPIEIPVPQLECPELPPELVYPFYAQADGATPGPVDKSLARPIDLGPLLRIDMGQATAVVGSDGSSAEARAAFGGGTSDLMPPAATVGSSRSESTTTLEGDDVVATSLTELTGVDLGGVLTIESMHLEVKAVALANGKQTSEVQTSYAGVSLGGTPVDVGPEGLVLEDGTPAGGDVLDQVAALLDFATGQIRGRVEFRPAEVTEGPGGSLVVDGGGFRYLSSNPDPLGEIVTLAVDIGQVRAEVSSAASGSGAPSADGSSPIVPSAEESFFSGGADGLRLPGFAASSGPVAPRVPESIGVTPTSRLASVLDVDLLRALYSLLASLALACTTLAGWRAHAQAAERRELLHAREAQ